MKIEKFFERMYTSKFSELTLLLFSLTWLTGTYTLILSLS
jgi:hypothetical protein